MEKVSRFLFSLLFLFTVLFAKAQGDSTAIESEVYKPPVPVELMIGNEALLFKMVVTKPIYNSKIKFYNLTTLESNFVTSSASNIFNQTVIFYDFNSKFSFGLGGSYSSYNSLKPIAAVLYSSFNANRGFLVQPSLVLEKGGSKELFSMFEYVHFLNPKLKSYFRIDAFTSWENTHDFSYLNWRVGVNTKVGNFGPAVNVNFVGKEALNYYNFGAFFNVLI